jgi:hypothetical protein
MQAKRQPFGWTEAKIRRLHAEARRAGQFVPTLMRQRAIDRIETRRQWKRQRGG